MSESSSTLSVPLRVGRALALVLFLDLTGTSAVLASAILLPSPGSPGLVIVGVGGLACAAIAVGMTGATSLRTIPSQRVLKAALALVTTGLLINTIGATLIILTAPGPELAAVVLLIGGDVLGILYVLLLRRAIAI